MASVAITPMESNFLACNGTFFRCSWPRFALLLFLLRKYVIPPINRAMTARQDAIREQFATGQGQVRGPRGRGGVQVADRRRAPRGRADPRRGPGTGGRDHRGDA